MISFFVADGLTEGTELELDESAAAHARARREPTGAPARLLDGRGAVGNGSITAIDKRRVVVRVDSVDRVPAPIALEVVVPVADRDRMLVAAEKCVELQVTAWRPAWFARSRSVSPRGEGPRFREKVEARMRSALEQSGGAWMPEVHEEAELDKVLGGIQAERKLVLDSSGTSMEQRIWRNPMALLIGPEGGFEAGELQRITAAGWHPVALSATILRFETAIIASVATVRAIQLGR